jgi:hypothetical protein
MKGLPVNKKFFSSWNYEMSYVLGVIAADGCLGIKRIRKDGSKQYLLDITNKNIFLLRKIKKTMKAQQKIGLKYADRDKREKYYRIQIGYQEICHDLLNLGIRPRKTYNQFIIKVPQKYFPDFVRGFFDGDGSVYIYKVNGVPQIKAKFSSTNLPLIIEFNQRVCKALNIPQKNIHQKFREKGKIPHYFIYFYVEDCEKLAEFLYGNNPTLYLPRKRWVFERWKSIKRRHYIKQNYPSKVGWHLNRKSFSLGCGTELSL